MHYYYLMDTKRNAFAALAELLDAAERMGIIGPDDDADAIEAKLNAAREEEQPS